MQVIKNNRGSQQKAFMKGKSFKRIIIDSQNGKKFIAMMLMSELSLLFSILRSLYGSVQLSSFFSNVVASISNALLLESDSHTNMTYIIRFSITFLHYGATSLCLILIFLKISRIQQESIEDMLAKTLTVLLIFSMPFMLFSAAHVYTSGYSTAIIDILNIAFSVFLTYFVDKISGEVEYGRKGSTRMNFRQDNTWIKIFRVIISCLFILLDDQKNLFIVAALFLLILSLIELSKSIPT